MGQPGRPAAIRVETRAGTVAGMAEAAMGAGAVETSGMKPRPMLA